MNQPFDSQIEELLTLAFELSGMTRSDAQGCVEALAECEKEELWEKIKHQLKYVPTR